MLHKSLIRSRMIFHAFAIAALAFVFGACSNTASTVQISQPPPVIGKTFTGDTLRGTLKGTIATRTKPYYMDASVAINAGDTLLLQPGVTIIITKESLIPNGSPEFQLFGTLISMGTKDQPNYITIDPSLWAYSNLTNAAGKLWGGIQCAPTGNPLAPNGSGDLILHWTHIEYTGGSAGSSDPIVTAKKVRYGILFQNKNANFIMEDCWITGATDDPVRVIGGNISLFRNVLEAGSNTSGDGFNIKTPTQGDIAYNVFIGDCTNGPKLANNGNTNPETNVNIYNNTIVTCGWRINQTARAGSTNIESGARGIEYNNLIVNCRTGFRLVQNPLADTANTAYDYQWYFGTTDSVVRHFNLADDGGIQILKSHDKMGAKNANDPMFVNYDASAFNPAVHTLAYGVGIDWTVQDPSENIMKTSDARGQRFPDVTKSFTSDFHLKSGSPCIGTAYTGAVKLNSGSTVPVPQALCPSKSTTNPYGTTGVKGLGTDFGAYQNDGSGNVQ